MVFLVPVASARASAGGNRHSLFAGRVEFYREIRNAHRREMPVLRGSPLLKPPPMQIDTIIEQFGEKYFGAVLFQFVHWLPSLLLMPYLTYFFLRDGNRLKKTSDPDVPNAYFEKTLLLFDRIDNSLQNFFLGLLRLTILDTVSLALVCGLSGFPARCCWIHRAVLAWLPYIGSALGCVLVVLVTAADFPNNPSITYGASCSSSWSVSWTTFCSCRSPLGAVFIFIRS